MSPSRASSHLDLLALQVIRDRHTRPGSHQVPATKPPLNLGLGYARNLPHPRTVPAPEGESTAPEAASNAVWKVVLPCPPLCRLPKLSLAVPLLSLPFDLRPGLANTTVQRESSALEKEKSTLRASASFRSDPAASNSPHGISSPRSPSHSRRRVPL